MRLSKAKTQDSTSTQSCFHFSCSKPSNPSLLCDFCPKILFCSQTCQHLHQCESLKKNTIFKHFLRKETHNDFKDSALKFQLIPEIRDEFEIISSITIFQPKDPPFEGVIKEFFRIKRKKKTENYILIIV